jgi:hypothetical protein
MDWLGIFGGKDPKPSQPQAKAEDPEMEKLWIYLCGLVGVTWRPYFRR